MTTNNLLFKAQGGELLTWTKSKGKGKNKIYTSLFIQYKWISEKGGMHLYLLTEGKKHAVSAEIIKILDIKADYNTQN